jgi:hypothetical protein
MNRYFQEIDESDGEPRFGEKSGSSVVRDGEAVEGDEEKNMADFEGRYKVVSQVNVLPARD